jgi:CTP-dependent riboflavin kinase
MDELDNKGITHIDSKLLANKLGISTHSASQYLSRLHRMGFLKRTRNKRRCITEKGNLCYKGYQYEYSFSSQGEQYIKWMKGNRIVEPILYCKIVNELANYLPEDVRNHIITSITIRENMKYKGPNRSLQTAGILAETLPYLTDVLAKGKTERKKLLKQNCSLENKCSDLKKKINVKNQEINELKSKNQQNEEIAIKLTRILSQHSSGWKIEKKVYEKIISDLRFIPTLQTPEKTDKYIKYIKNRYSKESSRAEKYFTNAEKEFKSLKFSTR